ncbi:MAG: SGNH/GDSL hydrolase family protein, partial [Bacteroidia bacterium]|nr:SGNH/GDSL hydrolase family protein [Bacteroidia bacterium]
IAFYKPTLVLFTLGSNELFIPAIKTREKSIQSILRQAQGTKFIWIGPPNWKEDTGINDLILANMDSTTFFLSKNLKLDRAKDGAHPSRIGGIVWADTLCSWIVHKSKYPIRLEKPPLPLVKK